MFISKSKGNYDLCSNRKDWQLSIHGLPAHLPSSSLSTTFPSDEEPCIDGLPPSQVAELIAERIESFWISTARERQRIIIEWIREHGAEIDAEWACQQIDGLQQKIAQLQTYIPCEAEPCESEK